MDDDKSILKGSMWMLGLAILLFWLPVLGPIIAGFVGGRKAGGPGAAFVAAILPAIVAAVLVGLVVVALPEIGGFIATLVGGVVFLAILVQSGLLILGAVAGGFFSHGGQRTHRGIRV